MVRKQSRDELLQALVREQDRAQALSSFVRSLAPTKGWHYVESKRGLSAWLVFVTEDSFADPRMVSHLGSAEWSKLQADLYFIESEQTEEPWRLESLTEAIRRVNAYRARFAQAVAAGLSVAPDGSFVRVGGVRITSG
jgi:hypothetical protein